MWSTSKFIREYKLIVCGGGGVGKSSVIIHLIQGFFIEEYEPTIEDSYRRQFVIDNEVALLDVLDTAGQEEYSAMREQYMRTCEGMILTYSVTSRESFEEMTTFQQQLLRVKDMDQFPMLVMANKADLESQRVVSILEGMDLARRFGCSFIEVSAKAGSNIRNAFFDLVREIRKFNREMSRLQTHAADLQPALQSKSLSFPRSISISTISRLFKPSKPAWDVTPEGEITRQLTLNRMLVKSARSNDKRMVRKLIAKGADPNAQPGVEGSALHAAAAVGHVDIVTLLLKEGAAINAKGPRGITALQAAAVEGHAAVVKVLLRRGAPVDARCGLYGTALVAAASRGHVKVVRLLIEHGADVTARGGPYGTALHAAAMLGKADLASILHGSGAEIDSRGTGDCTALQIAAFAGKPEVVRLLLDRGADFNLEGGKYGRALIAAYDRSHYDIVMMLLEKGASEEDLRARAQERNAAFFQHENTSVATITSQNAGTGAIFSDQRQEIDGQSRRDNGSRSQNPRAEYNELQQTSHRTQSAGHRIESAGSQALEQLPFRSPILSHQRTASPSTTTNFSKPTRAPPKPALSSSMNLLHGQDLLATHKHFEQGEEIPFKHVRPLGRGAFGVVDEVEYLQGRPGAATNAPATYARKVVQNTGSLHNYRMIQDEIDLLKRLRHKHVVRLLTTYSVERQYAIIMSPVADTNLRDYLASAQQEDKIYQWFGCLSAGLAYVHSQQIRHRDIKPANILVKGDSVLFTDFGIAKDFSEDATTSSTGTVDAKCYMYCAPEVAAEKPRGRPSDMFSLGCVFLEMVTVLMGQATISLSRLHESVTAHGRKAYHASLGKVQQWILTLCVQIAADAWGCLQSDNGFMLEWCFAILHPDPASRLSARSLYRLIQDVDSRVVRQRRFVATCCKIMRAEARSSESRGKTQFRLFERWPTAAFIPGDGEAKRWSDVAEQLGYKLPEGSYDDAVD